LNKTWQIIKREYFTRVRKKSFIVLTILGPLLLVGIGMLPVLFATISREDQKILVKDDSDLFIAFPDSAGVYFSFKYDTVALTTLKNNFSKLDDGYDALLVIPAGLKTDQPYGIEIYSNEQISITTRSYIENMIADQLEEINLRNRNLSKEELVRFRPHITIDDTVLSADQEIKNSDAAAATAIGYVMGFLTYIVLLIYGSMVMRGVMEEKTSRVIEVIISSVKPFQLMMGKIVGIGLVGLTQFLIWGLLVFVLQIVVSILFMEQFTELQAMQSASPDQFSGDAMQLSNMLAGFQDINIFTILFLFIIYFLGGFFLYAALFAAAGSLAGEDDGSDVQVYALPLTLTVVVSLLIMMTVVQQPDSKLAFWASIIPLTSPVVMPAIIPFDPPLWQIILSVVLLIAGFFFTTWLAGRVYRVGILMYGKKIKFREVLRWMFYKG